MKKGEPEQMSETSSISAEKGRWTNFSSGLGLRSKLTLARLAQPLAASSIGSFAVYAAGAGLSYIAQLVVARSIGPESFGIFAYVTAWVTLLAYLSTLGFHVTLLRFIPAYRATGKWQLIRGVVRFSQQRAFATGVVVALMGSAILWYFRESVRPELSSTFFIGIVSIPIISLHLVNASLVRAFGSVIKAIAPERLVRDSLVLTIVASVTWLGLVHADARMAMAAAFVSALATLAVLRVFMRHVRPPELAGTDRLFDAKDWYKPVGPLSVMTIADNVMTRVGVILLGLSGMTAEAGIFAVALSMSLLSGLPRTAVSTAFAPQVSDLHARHDQDGLQALSAKASVLSLLGTVAIGVPLMLLSGPLLRYFGKDFVSGEAVVIILVLGQIFAAACGPQQHLINMTGNERSGAMLLAVCAGLNLAVCLVTIKLFGLPGAALAMTGSLITWNIAMSVYIRRHLNLRLGLVAAFDRLMKRRLSIGSSDSET